MSILDRAVVGMRQRTPEWHAARRAGIGGSDAPAVLGLSPRATPFEVWLDKTSALPSSSHEDETMVWGRVLEPAIRGEYQRRSDAQVVEVGLLRHPDFPWLICSPDGVSGERILEIKTARHGAEWGDQGTDEIPLHYLVQAHHLLIVSGAAVVDVAVLIAGSEYRLYHVEPDTALHTQIIDQEWDFWHNRVERHDPPPVRTIGDAVRRWGRLARAGAVVATPPLVSAVESLRQVKTSLKEGERHFDELKLGIMAALGDAGDTLIDDAGQVLATWKLTKGRAAYTVKAMEPFRQFLLKGQ